MSSWKWFFRTRQRLPLYSCLLGLALSGATSAEDTVPTKPLTGTLILTLEISLPDLALKKASVSEKAGIVALPACNLCALGTSSDKCAVTAGVCQGLVRATARYWEHASVIYTEGSPACVTLNWGGTLVTYPVGCR